jgi:hypothetical protein
LIDSIRKQIEERLEQLRAEAEKLRHALVALDPRGESPPRSPTATPRGAHGSDSRAPHADSPNEAPHGAPRPLQLELDTTVRD